jgi:iron complex transport system substrate-binding protein
VLIVFTSPNLISCELAESQTGEMVRMLGGVNIIDGSFFKSNSRVNFSLERIALLDPDIILINTMGDVDACKERLLHELAANSAWAALRAVRRGRVHYLPKSLFLYKPSAHYPRAFRYLATILYPEVFGSLPAINSSLEAADNATAF